MRLVLTVIPTFQIAAHLSEFGDLESGIWMSDINLDLTNPDNLVKMAMSLNDTLVDEGYHHLNVADLVCAFDCLKSAVEVQFFVDARGS